VATRLEGRHPARKKALTTFRPINDSQDLITFKKLRAKARCLLRSSKKGTGMTLSPASTLPFLPPLCGKKLEIVLGGLTNFPSNP